MTLPFPIPSYGGNHAPMQTPAPAPGDDLGMYSIIYRNMPQGHRLRDILPEMIGSAEVKALLFTQTEQGTAPTRMMEDIEVHFADWEPNAETIAQWKELVRDRWSASEDTIARVLDVYNDDIAKPILGRTETVSFDNYVESDTGDSSLVEMPVAGSDQSPTSKTLTGATHSRSGRIITELSDLGVRPNYESLNGFIDQNRTMTAIIEAVLQPCFTLVRAYY